MDMRTNSKTIYYCWFGNKKPQKVMECINNWKEKLSDYEIIEINDKNTDLFNIEEECQNNLWFKTVYENKMWAYVSDYARLKVLYDKGGVYFDTDITVEKNIDELLKKRKLVLGWEDEKSINFAVALVERGNKIIKQMLDFYSEEIWHSKLYTIPQVATYVLKKNYHILSSDKITENEEVLILPKEYFYPVPIGLKEKANFLTENTYTIHWWDASWVKSNIDYFLRNKHKIQLEQLINECFKENIILDNPFLKIEKLCKQYNIKIDFHYIFKFKYKYEYTQKYLTVFLFGKQIKLFKSGENNKCK